MNIQDLLKLIKEVKVEFVDYKFVDFLGQWQHFTAPIAEYSDDLFTYGIGFDGSSIRGFQKIHESDMLLIPDMNSSFIDPFMEHTTLSFICDVKDPVCNEMYSRDPRTVAMKAEQYLVSSGLGDTAYFGPEPEFFIFDDVRFDQREHEAFHFIDSVEGSWNKGTEEMPNLGHKPRFKGGYFPVPPVDKFQDLRSEMVKKMTAVGIEAEVQHHEVATAGQAEIDMRFNTLLRMADDVLKYKYVVKNVAYQAGHTVTFMPKPIYKDNGSGMHCHQSVWKDGKNLFYGEGGYANLSDFGRWYIGGILKHSPSILAFAAPTTNSYRRLVPGFEAPVSLVYSERNRSAAVRIPTYSQAEKAKRIEVRYPDPSCNPYFAFSAMLMAGLDGVENQIEPPAPVDKDLYELSDEEKASIQSTPGSLEEAIKALEQDQEYLKKGNVFTQDVIDMWISWKRENEIDDIRLRPHPAEFMLYYDV